MIRESGLRHNHDKLMGQAAKRVADKRLLKLIRAFLHAGVMENGLVSPSVERAEQRVMESITRFITQKLKVKVNEANSAVARPQERKFLAFSFTAGPEVKRVIAPKALDRFKRRVREIKHSNAKLVRPSLPLCGPTQDSCRWG